MPEQSTKGPRCVALLIAKILIMPALMSASAFVGRRWGQIVGGWVLGLPIVSGPVSIFLFVERGPGFAERAAQGTLLGFLAAGAFCACYALLAENHAWYTSLAASVAAFGVTAWVFAPIHVDWLRAGLLVAAILSLLARAVAPDGTPSDVRAPRYRKRDMALQVGFATLAIVAITAGAGLLGSKAAGMLAPLPVISAVMATSSIRRSRAGAARELLRGAVVGSWGGAAFFTVAGLLLGVVGPVPAYLTATAAAAVGGSAGIRLNH